MENYFYSTSSSCWSYNRWLEPSTAFRMDRHRFKAYVYRPRTCVYASAMVKVDYMLAMNYNKDNTTFELMYKTSGEYGLPTRWVPVSVETMERFFRKEDGKMEFCSLLDRNREAWEKNTKVEVVDGHYMFSYNTEWLRFQLGSIAQDKIGYSLPGKMVNENNEYLAFTLVYPDKKFVLADAIEIDKAYCQIRNVEWSIKHMDGEYSSKTRLHKRLQEAKNDLELYEKNYQRVLDNAADAMNILSTKYGVEIEI